MTTGAAVAPAHVDDDYYYYDWDHCMAMRLYLTFASALDSATDGKIPSGKLPPDTEIVHKDMTGGFPHFIAVDARHMCVVFAVKSDWNLANVHAGSDVLLPPRDRTSTDIDMVHDGVLDAVYALEPTTVPMLQKLATEHPDYLIRLVGHGMGGSIAAVMAIRNRDKIRGLKACAYGPLPCISPSLVRESMSSTSTIINDGDIVARASKTNMYNVLAKTKTATRIAMGWLPAWIKGPIAIYGTVKDVFSPTAPARMDQVLLPPGMLTHMTNPKDGNPATISVGHYAYYDRISHRNNMADHAIAAYEAALDRLIAQLTRNLHDHRHPPPLPRL